MIVFRDAAKLLSMGGNLPWAQSLLRRCFRHARTELQITDFDGDMRINLRLSEHMQRRIFWMDYYNQDIVALLKKIVQPGMTLIDVGANIGEITLVAAKLVGSSGKVIAFEPMTDIALSLERNVENNHLDQVVIARLGLADTISTAPIYASCGQGQVGDEHQGLGSLYGGTSGDHPPVDSIQLTTLDVYLQSHPTRSLDIIKIDIEGAELPCLKGAARTLELHRPFLIIEVQEQTSRIAGYHQEDILDYLRPLDYTFHTIGRHGKLTPIRNGKLDAYQNVLCVPPTRDDTNSS
jgi:FkbM family methyltransferase